MKILLTRRMQDIVGRAFASCVDMHALALAACFSDKRELKVGDK